MKRLILILLALAPSVSYAVYIPPTKPDLISKGGKLMMIRGMRAMQQGMEQMHDAMNTMYMGMRKAKRGMMLEGIISRIKTTEGTTMPGESEPEEPEGMHTTVL